MDATQAIADAMEDVAIARYVGGRTASETHVPRRLTCGACGVTQTVRVQSGMRLAGFVCRACNAHTRAWV
jgi:hypothetical protein